MGELFGLSSILRGVGIAYMLFALVCLALAIYLVKGIRGKTIAAGVVLAIFSYVPVSSYLEKRERDAYAAEAWAYFKRLCDERSGEKIYKTYTEVKSVVVIKPLPPATERDMYDQYWYGDPYSASAHSQRGILEAAILASPRSPVSLGKPGRGFDFVEVQTSAANGKSNLQRISYSPNEYRYETHPITQVNSRFAIYWEDISTPFDRHFWIAGSRLQIKNLKDESIVAERIGYFIEAGFGSTAGQRRPWLTSRGPQTTCPYAHDWSDRWFVLKVLNPTGGEADAK